MYYGYIYKITNLINGKIYIGLHTASVFDEKYWGSGSDLKAAQRLYGLENFSREILQWCDSLEDLNRAECYWIDHLNSRNPEVGYNIQPGGVSHFGYKHSESTKQRLREKSILRGSHGFWINNGSEEKYNKSHEPIPEGYVKGRLKSTMKAIANKKRGKPNKKKAGSKSPKGTKWFTNGSIDIMRHECPEGFWPGRTHHQDWTGENNPSYGKPSPRKGLPLNDTTKARLSATQKARNKDCPRAWINNGVIESLHIKSEPLPEGFTSGRLLKNKK